MAASETGGSDLDRAVVRFSAHVLGLTLSAVAAPGLFIATIVLVLHGGADPGPMLGQLRYFFPGYSVSFGGAFIGAAWAAVTFYALGAVFGLCFGGLLLHQARPAAFGQAGPGRGVAHLPPLAVGLTTGAVLAAGLFVATVWLLLTAGGVHPHLSLLGNYLPGYETNLPGSVVGAFWAFLYGLVIAGSTAWIYNRVAGARLRRSD